MFQLKEQDKTSEKELKEVEISNLTGKKLKVIVTKVLTELRRRMDEHSENFNKEIKNIRKYQTRVITELKNTLED